MNIEKEIDTKLYDKNISLREQLYFEIANIVEVDVINSVRSRVRYDRVLSSFEYDFYDKHSSLMSVKVSYTLIPAGIFE